jgi:hypothetical protein
MRVIQWHASREFTLLPIDTAVNHVATLKAKVPIPQRGPTWLAIHVQFRRCQEWRENSIHHVSTSNGDDCKCFFFRAALRFFFS